MEERIGTEEFLERLFNLDFNDAYLLLGQPIRYIEGYVYRHLDYIVDRELIEEIASRVGYRQEGFYRKEKVNLRVHLIKGEEDKYTACILRKLFSYIPDTEEIKLPKVVVDNFISTANAGQGGIGLVIGKQRQGKTTSIISMINEYNKKYQGVIITIENPIEYKVQPLKSIVIQKDIKAYSKEDISNAMEQALIDSAREFPTILFVGEIRTSSEVEAVVRLAESGVFVIGTFHGENIPSAIFRFMSMLRERDQFKVSTVLSLLKFIMGLRLLPNRDDETKLELITEYLLFDIHNAEQLPLYSFIKENKIQDFFTRFATNRTSTFMKNLSVSLQEAEREGRISAKVRENADIYSRVLKVMTGR